MDNLILYSYWEHNILQKYKSMLESRYKVKVNMPEIKNSDSCASNEVIFVNVVGDNQNIINVKKFVRRKMEFMKCRKKRESDSSVIILDSDSENELDDKVLSENRLKKVKRNRPFAQTPLIDLEASPDLVENHDTVACCKSKLDQPAVVAENFIPLHTNSNISGFCNSLPSAVNCDNDQSVIIDESFITYTIKSKQTASCNSPPSSVVNDNDQSVIIEEGFIPLSTNSKNIAICESSSSPVANDNDQSVIIEESFIPLSTNSKKIAICESSSSPVANGNDQSVIIEDSFISLSANSFKTDSGKIFPSPAVCDIIEISSDEESVPDVTAPRKLRPVVIDGSNVARSHGKPYNTYSCKGIKLCVEYFLKRGHTQVTAFVPMFRRHCKKGPILTTDQDILEELEKTQHVVFTPSRRVDGKTYTCYDDRFIVELAATNGGVILSNDNYKDLIDVSPAFKETIEKRLLMFCFVGDMLMVPDDPLGSKGPTLDEFLSFPPSTN